MKLDYSIKFKQEQKMIFTQEMQQSIKLLQMSLHDLREYINNEYSENPVLEVKDIVNKEDLQINEQEDYEKYLNDNFDNYRDESGVNYSRDEDTSPLNYIEKKKSLKEYLYEQLVGINESDYNINIAKYIIESLDYKGYLDMSIEQLSNELNLPEQDILTGLKIVQNLEPYGIGARSVKECLLLQSSKLNILDDIIEKMILNHLEDIAQNKYEDIAKALNINAREAQRYGDLIKKLEPKPSRGFYTGDEVSYIIPDAEVKEVNGEFYIVMNESVLPKLTINKTYKEALKMDKNFEATEYVKDKINQAVFLIKSIEQRKNTLYRVLECLLDKQRSFFEKGSHYIKPLTLKEVADEIKLHESTVSRAIKDKYVLTSFGTIKIKDLFQSSVKYCDNSNESITNITIKNEIKSIVNGENKSKPLSDQCISLLLKEKNMNISRRTVAKYREELGIKSSSLRKRL